MHRCGSAAPATLLAAPASSGIPFRTDPAVSVDRFVLAMLAVSVLFVAAIALLYLARRKGWLAGAPGGIAAGKSGNHELSVQASRRVSPFTTVHVIARGKQQFLVVESARGVTAQLHALDVPNAKEESAS